MNKTTSQTAKKNDLLKSGGKRKTRVVIIVAVVLVAIFGAVAYGYNYGRNYGWWGEKDSMKRIKADPLSSEKLPGLRLEYSEQWVPTGFMTKSTQAFVTRWFVSDDDSLEEAKEEVIRYAEENGWEYDESSSTDEYWNGVKPSAGGGAMRLHIRIEEPGVEWSRYEGSNRVLRVDMRIY